MTDIRKKAVRKKPVRKVAVEGVWRMNLEQQARNTDRVCEAVDGHLKATSGDLDDIKRALVSIAGDMDTNQHPARLTSFIPPDFYADVESDLKLQPKEDDG